jgi:hypothetical protein
VNIAAANASASSSAIVKNQTRRWLAALRAGAAGLDVACDRLGVTWPWACLGR